MENCMNYNMPFRHDIYFWKKLSGVTKYFCCVKNLAEQPEYLPSNLKILFDKCKKLYINLIDESGGLSSNVINNIDH